MHFTLRLPHPYIGYARLSYCCIRDATFAEIISHNQTTIHQCIIYSCKYIALNAFHHSGDGDGDEANSSKYIYIYDVNIYIVYMMDTED